VSADRIFFDDFDVGQTTTVGHYLITEDEIIEFASKWDPEPFHVDAEAASASVFGGLTACGTHIIAIRNWLIHRLPNKAHVLAGLGIDELRFSAPVRPGDQLSLTNECVETRPSSSKPDRGIVRSRLTVTNQDGVAVLTTLEAILVARCTASY
jgi:acyl dehydratase